MPSKGIYNLAIPNILPTTIQVRKQSTKRLKSKREQIIQKAKHSNRINSVFQVTAQPNIRVKSSCTFYWSNNPGENVKNCKKRKYLQKDFKRISYRKKW